ncbi:GNAT family N-acetyltransferase [Nocardiopsis tropica]|uniref:GNAT family N-acetyltransferase n=1 Tax=Tsukamurella TaxID=2060 RepID=UPI001C7DF452|nr:GNAT family N-acetyltransferase [Tsukamurella sp. TY48]GIZ96149.1 GCN5-related N-acetyltransferase [Tsukamurella sp. TY48]
MTQAISRADFADPALAEFLAAHLADMAPTAPPESQHALDLTELQHPRVRLWTLHEHGALLGTIALAEVEPGHEELKSMRAAPQARGRGIGRALLAFAIDDARSRGIARISLETGSQDFFAPARALYRAHGFTDTGPFGGYVVDPNSTYLTLAL